MARTVPTPAQPKGPGQVTVADIQEYTDYYTDFRNPGREAARESFCPHGYRLTDSCPNCPSC
ncbi:hypothetical protein [Streptomyces sp. NPDC060366]|uniref:hypothetical protein n=1 Tax=Streptomyces sp. NPDC060366 TaxID=3347105 RepID=UPI003661FBDD